MQAFGRNQTLFEPKTRGVVSGESATGKGFLLAGRPLAFEPSPKKAQTFKPIGGSVPKGFYRNPLTFQRRFAAVKKWLRL
jgi:hypothetical protein